MNTLSRTISGVIAFVLGGVVILDTLKSAYDMGSLVLGVTLGMFMSGVGIYLFLNKKEDAIEEIKKNKKE